jgi:predicted SnoaL-like aldol condensation-catalyzing enzyme
MSGRAAMEVGAIEIATAFLQAVASKNPDLATTYIDPDRYVEHDPLAADGAFGLIEYIEPSTSSICSNDPT